MRKGLKLVSLILIGLFLMSFSASFVSAEPVDAVKEFVSDASDMIGGVISAILESMGFETFGEGGKNAMAQFLLMFITVMLIFSVLDFIKMPRLEWGKWLISIAMGLLAFVFIDPATIKALAEQYTLMAVVINVLLPATIVLVFVWKINNKVYIESGTMSPLVAKMITLLTGAGAIVYIYYMKASFGDIAPWAGKVATAVMWILGIATAIVVIWGGSLAGWVGLAKVKHGLEREKMATRTLISARMTELRKLISTANEADTERLKQEYNVLAKKIKVKRYTK